MMSTDVALQRLLTWFSPAFPIGAFSYSHGLEAAVDEGFVTDRAGLERWIVDLLRHGAGWNDALLLKAAYDRRTAGQPLVELVELCLALCTSAELELETVAQGRAFAETTKRVWFTEEGSEAGDYPLPIAVGRAAANANLPLLPVIEAFLHGFAANLVSAAVRAVPLGQTDGLLALAAQEALIRDLAADAFEADLDQLGGFVPMLEWCSMRHETQYTRLFRS